MRITVVSVAPFVYVKANDEYASGFGKYEENYSWKLNEVIAAGYTDRRAKRGSDGMGAACSCRS